MLDFPTDVSLADLAQLRRDQLAHQQSVLLGAICTVHHIPDLSSIPGICGMVAVQLDEALGLGRGTLVYRPRGANPSFSAYSAGAVMR